MIELHTRSEQVRYKYRMDEGNRKVKLDFKMPRQMTCQDADCVCLRYRRALEPHIPRPQALLERSSRSYLALYLCINMAVPANTTYPSGGTWFETLHKSFVDVSVDSSSDNAIPTSAFLEAAESLTTLFGQ